MRRFVIEPKPLSKERRVEIQHPAFGVGYGGDTEARIGIQDLIAAEQFWREAVKEHCCVDIYENETECLWCHASAVIEKSQPVIEHKPDCPWLLAQEIT
jgi:hypothetical protein